MKKLIIVSTAILALCCSFVSLPRAAATVPIAVVVVAPGPANPYCGKTAADFPVPTIDCPTTGTYVVNINCANFCMDYYQDNMVNIYAAACIQYTEANDNYDEWLDVVLLDLQGCLDSATTPAEKQACRDAASVNINNLISTLITTRANIANGVADGMDYINEQYLDCASNCCVLVHEPGGH